MAQLAVMAGLPGVGKSSVAEALARGLRWPVLAVDPIEAALLGAGFARSFETGLAGYLVAEALAGAQLALGLDVIVDAVNAEEVAKDTWRRLAVAHGAELRVIECRCSDEVLHRARLEQRRRGLGDLPEPSWDAVQRRADVYTAWSEGALVLDSVRPLAENVATALAWLGRGTRAAR